MEEIEQRWLYALSAPSVALNPNASYTDPGYCSDLKFVDVEGGWGITNRQQLLEMLRFADNGHAVQLEDAYHQWERCLPSQWQALLARLGARDRVLYELASRTFSECGSGGIRAWDLGRMGFLLRAAVLHGWINLDESLWLHGGLALRARHYYDSWASYFNGFVVGRSIWNCMGNSDEDLAHELDRKGDFPMNTVILERIDRDASQLFAQLPWDMALNLPERPASLAEFNWS
ncbi:DUF1266 domain-containing protein [Pseudomonas purpurea]|uniref:DUF1266 domain-containing protein n=1 Tax=Pseudomonas purpurea TaxID=3136737 RepID=UPI0032647E69